jgi:hypothetical protein
MKEIESLNSLVSVEREICPCILSKGFFISLSTCNPSNKVRAEHKGTWGKQVHEEPWQGFEFMLVLYAARRKASRYGS